MTRIINGIEKPYTPSEAAEIAALKAEYNAPEKIRERTIEQVKKQRILAKGSIASQLEYMETYGFDAWQQRMLQINAQFPLPNEN